jgi:O-Antigen ligase
VMARIQGAFGRVSVGEAITARCALYLATAYVALTTDDVDIARVPLKLLVVAFALASWLDVYRPWERSWRSYAFGAPVLAVGILVPVVWFVLALVLHRQHDPAQPENTSYAIQQASRFAYLLLYFPIRDEVSRCGAAIAKRPDWPLLIHRVWLWPTLALCAITLLIFLGHVFLGLDYGGGEVGPLQGDIAVESTGTFRVFLVDDVMLIPATILVLATAYREQLGRLGRVSAFALLATVYLAHARGIWVGIIVAAAVVVLISKRHVSRSAPRRLAAIALILGLATALIVTADPSVSHGVASLFNERNEQSTSVRLEQAPQLIRGFRRHVALGSGLGATLPSGYHRSTSAPWSFELTYLQLLFQLGVIGLVILLTVPAAALFFAFRALSRAEPNRRIMIAAGIGGLVGFVFTSASNPYLMSSVGMLALAVLLVMIEYSATPASASVGKAQSPNASTVLAPAWVSRSYAQVAGRLASVRPRLPTVVILALILVLGVAEFDLPRQLVPSSTTSLPHLPVPRSAPRRDLLLPRDFVHDGRAQLVADSDVGATESRLWSVTYDRGVLRVSSWHVEPKRIVVDDAVTAGPAPEGDNVSFGIIGAGVDHPAALGVMARVGSHLHVELRDLASHGRVLVAGDTPPIPLPAGYYRDVGLADWNGIYPDLIVIDRSASAPVMRVRIFSAASAFRQEILDVIVPKGPFPPAAFSALIGSVSSGADVVLITRGVPTPTTRTEVHILLGSDAFQSYVEQSPINLPDTVPRETPFLLGRENGLPVLYVVNRAAGTLEAVQLA